MKRNIFILILFFLTSLAHGQTTKFSRVVSDSDVDSTLNDALSGIESAKQDALISGTNIKTINSESLLGSGNIVVAGVGGDGDSSWTSADADTMTVDSLFRGPSNAEGYYTIIDTTGIKLGGHINSVGFSNYARNRQAGENLSQYDVCIFKADGKMWKALADDAATSSDWWIGVLLEDTLSTDESGLFSDKGISYGHTGLTIGTQYYVSTTVAGGIQSTLPAAGTQFIPYGKPIGTTKIEFNISFYAEVAP